MTKHDSKTAESVTLQSRGVSSCGEVLVGSIQVQTIMQSMVDDYESALKNQNSELVELRKKNAELEKMLIKLVDDDCNEWYRLEILNLLNGVDNL